ncbi:heme ABC transporter [Haemophilus paracuniculus]|uniref:Heme ABC transporter n=1 Tax=Haemophilus paracuniculus TaxID=734 RepID=A0A1T0ASU3_9PAST|nr:ABC transporter ATP-binding protein [Haemophilus paracuniculus]OOR99719.1 heme ABC transporter [Haemophilus paracuniculus]
MLNVENISLAYGLHNVSCQIPQGKLVGIMGANGAGKSTLLKSLAGILPLARGEIWLNSSKLSEMSPQQKSQLLAYLAQSTAIQWDLSVYDVIALGLAQPLRPADERVKIQQIAQQFAVADLLEKPFQQLSGGEKTRVQLARCCIKGSPLILADEPIAALDPYYQIDIMEKLKALTPHRTCVIVIHHLSLAYQFCDEIILLDHGKLLAAGDTASVLTPQNLAQAFGIKVEIDQERKEIFGVGKLA